MAGTKERPEGVDVPALERSDDAPHALVLGNDVTQTTRVAALDLGPPLCVAGMLERVADTAESTTTTARPSGRGTWRYSSLPQSSRSAWPRRARSEHTGAVARTELRPRGLLPLAHELRELERLELESCRVARARAMERP